MHTKSLSGNLKERNHSEDLEVDGRIILGWILRKYGGKSSDTGRHPMAGFCEHGNEPSGSIKGEEFLD
jgi:hypothetical protein